MKMTSILFGCGLALMACKKKGEDAAPAGDRCTTAIHASVDKMLSKSKEGGAPPQMLEIAEKLRTIMTERCKADGWPDAVITCFSNATDQPSIKACRTQLPQDQAQKLQTEIIKVMSGAAGGFRGTPGGSNAAGPHGSAPPEGGPMGGAGAGSATPGPDGSAPPPTGGRMGGPMGGAGAGSAAPAGSAN